MAKELDKNSNKFSLDEICQNSKQLFGVYPEVIYGALFGMDKKKEFTLSEVSEAIDKFIKKEVR